MIPMPIALSGGARITRRVVTQNHHRSDFALLLADVEHHFQALAQTPADVLRHIGSPFAPDTDQHCSSVTRSGRIINLEAYSIIASSPMQSIL